MLDHGYWRNAGLCKPDRSGAINALPRKEKTHLRNMRKKTGEHCYLP